MISSDPSGVEVQVVVTAPGHRHPDLADCSYNGCVIGKHDECVGAMDGGAVMSVQREQVWTQATVLRNTSGEDDGGATCWGLFLRKSWIQRQRGSATPAVG